MNINFTYRTQGIASRFFAATFSKLRTFSVQTSTRLFSLAREQEPASWHHTCISTTASDQLHPAAMLTSFRLEDRQAQKKMVIGDKSRVGRRKQEDAPRMQTRKRS